MISLQNVGVRRNSKTILQNINIEIQAKNHLAVIGPNGAGKSFLLRIMSADIIPSSGDVTILGKTFGKTNLWELRKKIGFVSSQLIFWYGGSTTVMEVVGSGFNGTLGLPNDLNTREKEQVFKILRSFKMESFIDRVFKTLSDGEKRKVLLARALVWSPEIVIFDEPCMGLDIPTREFFLQDIEALSKNILVIYVTHHLEELPTCIKQVLYLKNGTVWNSGPKEKMLTSQFISEVFAYDLKVIAKQGKYYLQ